MSVALFPSRTHSDASSLGPQIRPQAAYAVAAITANFSFYHGDKRERAKRSSPATFTRRSAIFVFFVTRTSGTAKVQLAVRQGEWLALQNYDNSSCTAYGNDSSKKSSTIFESSGKRCT